MILERDIPAPPPILNLYKTHPDTEFSVQRFINYPRGASGVGVGAAKAAAAAAGTSKETRDEAREVFLPGVCARVSW